MSIPISRPYRPTILPDWARTPPTPCDEALPCAVGPRPFLVDATSQAASSIRTFVQAIAPAATKAVRDLLEHVPGAIRARHYSRRTEKAYLGWIRRFISFNGGRDPSELGARDVSQFLSMLAVRGNVAASTQNQAFSALLFLYREVIGLELTGLDETIRAKRPQRIPQVLTPAEVQSILWMVPPSSWPR